MSLLLPVAVYCHIGSNVAAAIVGEPFDGERQAIDPTEPMFDGSHHQVTHVLASDAARSGEELIASRSQQSSAKAIRTLSPLSQPISKPSEHQRRLRSSTAMRPSCRRSAPPAWRSSTRPWAFITR